MENSVLLRSVIRRHKSKSSGNTCEYTNSSFVAPDSNSVALVDTDDILGSLSWVTLLFEVSITIAAINGKPYLKGNSQPYYRPYQPQLLRRSARGGVRYRER
jgi:hypothetical protein